MPLRFWALSALAIGVAVLIFYGIFQDDRRRAQEACAQRGGQVVIESDPQSIGQYCVLPSGEKTPL